MNVSAIIVTRGDVDLRPIVQSIPWEWETLVWNNGQGEDDPGLYRRMTRSGLLARRVLGWSEYPDLAVFGRYAAIEQAQGDLIYVQDDDCIVSDPQALVDEWKRTRRAGQIGKSGMLNLHVETDDFVVCNMPQKFRYAFYEHHALVGFGAAFHRSLPTSTWGRLTAALGDAGFPRDWARQPSFLRTCDIPFTALNPRVLVDVPYQDMPWASTDSRMWKQPTHREERKRMLDLVLEVRDARS
jgi:hypothetical protein